MAGTVERTLALKLIGDVSGLRKDLKPVGRQFGQLTKSALSWGKALSGAVVLGGLEKVVSGLGDAFKGFKSGQRVAAQLRKTWKNLGLQGKSYGRTLDAITDSTLRLGTSDDEAVAAFTRSIQRTKDYDSSLKELRIAQDLVANGSAPNLDAAMRIIQQAAKGSARVVDRFGLDSKTAAGRVNELGRQVRGAAREKAKLDPFGVLFNRLAEDAETIVGTFASGDFSGFVKGLQGLGTTIDEALFGRFSKKRGRKVGGLVKRFGNWAGQIADGIAEEFGKVDWGKALGGALDAGVKALSTASDNGTLSRLAIVGTAIAGGIFAVDLFVTAATKMFGAPKWLVSKTWDVATKAAGLLIGKVFAGAMFVAELFMGVAADMFRGVTKLPAFLVRSLRGFGRLLGTQLGLGILAGIAGALAAVAIRDAIAGKLDEAFGTDIFSTAAKGSNSPLDIFVKNLQDLFGGGFASGTAGATSGWHWVGERGPELLRFRGTEKVMDNRSSMRAMGGTTVVNVTVNAPVAADGARVGRDIAAYLDQFLARGGRLRHAPALGR